MSTDLFLILLTISTVITISLTEFVKRLLIVTETPYRCNVVVWFCTMLACTSVGAVYRIPFGLGFSGIQVVRLMILMLCTWTSAMYVYDKIVQTIKQHKYYKSIKQQGRYTV